MTLFTSIPRAIQAPCIIPAFCVMPAKAGIQD